MKKRGRKKKEDSYRTGIAELKSETEVGGWGVVKGVTIKGPRVFPRKTFKKGKVLRN